MIEFEHAETYGWEAAVRGARNPLQSWNKIDSGYCTDEDIDFLWGCKGCNVEEWCRNDGFYQIGPNDHALLLNLAKAGPEHGKYLRMIGVTVDITMPAYFMAELSTYKIGTTMNSTSLQHTGASRDFTIDDFTAEAYENPLHVVLHCGLTVTEVWDRVLKAINELRCIYKDTGDYMFFRWMRQLMPMGYNYTITWSANYAVLRNIYHQRRNHQLQEWRDFCAWIESLPYSDLITKKLDAWIKVEERVPEESAFVICAIEATISGNKTTYVEPCYFRKSTGDWETAKGYRLNKSACKVYKWKPLPPVPDNA